MRFGHFDLCFQFCFGFRYQDFKTMKSFLDMLYPRRCVDCGVSSPSAFRYMCWDCWSDAVKVEAPFCERCGDPVAGAVEHTYVCYSCSARKPAFDAARSAARYDGAIAEALRLLKYEKAMWLAPDLAKLMHGCLEAEYSGMTFDLVVPVPLHHVRRRERGYNQSAVLARELGRLLMRPARDGAVRRVRPTATQTNLTAKERLSNVTGAFKHGRTVRLAGRHVLLIDDVMTTGATVNACAAALRKGGAASIHVITAARG
jgi:ComF family protein